jgi:hypothetical protein
MQKNKIYKIVADRPTPRSPKIGYLAKAKFKIGPASHGGNSEAVMVVYKIDGSKPDYWYSKDCKHFMQYHRFWSLEKYGLPYLRNIFKNGGDSKNKIDITKVQKVLIYPSVYAPKQQPIEVLFDRRTYTATQPKADSTYILLAPKRPDLRTSEADRYFRFLSQDYYTNGSINLELTLNSLMLKFMKWENKNDPKSNGRLMVYDIATRKPVAEMSSLNGVFFEPFTCVKMFSHDN